MPIIESVEAIPYNVALKDTLKWGRGHELAHLYHVLVRVRLDDGAVGIAEATPRPTIYGETQVSVQHILTQELTPLLVGQVINSRADIDDLDRSLHGIKNNNTAKGALNMALHMALAESQGQSACEYLGVAQTHVPVSYIVGTGSDDVVYQDVARVYDAGVRVFKMKIGKQLDSEMRLIARLQTDFADAQFYADANQCLTVADAVEHLQQLSDMGVLYCEEPLPVHQLQARQTLCQNSALPLIADDSAFTLDELEREIAFDTFDIINIKTARTGFSQSQAMVQMARTAGKTIMVGSQASSIIGATHTALFAAAIQAEHATECTFFLKTQPNDIQELPVIENGLLDVQQMETNLPAYIAAAL